MQGMIKQILQSFNRCICIGKGLEIGNIITWLAAFMVIDQIVLFQFLTIISDGEIPTATFISENAASRSNRSIPIGTAHPCIQCHSVQFSAILMFTVIRKTVVVCLFHYFLLVILPIFLISMEMVPSG